MEDLAAHVKDIDIYHTVEDKAAYNGGLFWHSFHYVDAATATHRTYSRSKVTGGGGPSSEHNYTTGLMLHYLLSGDPSSRDAVVGLADWVVQMDDGRKTVFKWLHSGPTGHATASGSFLYHGPGRGAANSLNALLDGHRLAGDRGFLTKAEQLIRRVIHPNDDIAARDLLDTERKWFYTIFLQVLARYLDVKAVAGELDDMYAYARDSLLHYARWMRDHEYPYLDKPELLEFPTESWAAQDIRKSEIFDFAALHAKAADRAAFRERAAFFHEYATRTLGGLPTRTRARPTVIMLSNGFRRRYFAKNTDNTAPAAAATRPYGAPEVFVPQKVVARKRLGWLVIGAGVVLVLLLVLALLLL
jgi:hypothetical protein